MKSKLLITGLYIILILILLIMNSEYRSRIFLYENRLKLFMDNEDLILDNLGKKLLFPGFTGKNTVLYYHLNDLNTGSSVSEMLYLDSWLQDKKGYEVLVSGVYNDYVLNLITSEKQPQYPIRSINADLLETAESAAAVYVIDSSGICRHCWVLDAEQRNRSLLNLNALEALYH